MSKAETLKLVIKKPGPKARFGIDPTNPWSMKANINEDKYLDQYLSTRGINPKFVTKNIKVAHSKSNEYLNWRRTHAESVVYEETDKKDMVCFDIPLLIRVLEFTREEMSSDIELHNMVERLINMRETYPLTMTEYDAITQKLVKENHIAIAMGKMLDDESGMVLTQIEELERGCAMIRSYIGKDYEKQLPAWVQAKITLATDYMSTVGNYLVSKNEKVNEDLTTGRDSTDIRSTTSKSPTLKRKSQLDQAASHYAIPSPAGSMKHTNESSLGDDFLKMLKDKGIKHRVHGTPEQEKQRTMDKLAANKAKVDAAPKSTKTDNQGGFGTHRGYGQGRYMGDSVELEGNHLNELSKDTLDKFITKSKETYKNVPNEKKGNRLRNVLKAAEKRDAKNEEVEIDESKSAAVRLGAIWNREKAKSSASIQRGKEMMDKIKQDVKAKSEKPPIKEDRMKSARIIKSIYKKKNMKEEMYDHEKDDKGNQSYGKPPKVGKSKEEGESTNKAAAILKGGTTLTGKGRDTVEIDPMMRVRPTTGSPEDARSKKSIG
jgi:hypothetical protein